MHIQLLSEVEYLNIVRLAMIDSLSARHRAIGIAGYRLEASSGTISYNATPLSRWYLSRYEQDENDISHWLTFDGNITCLNHLIWLLAQVNKLSFKVGDPFAEAASEFDSKFVEDFATVDKHLRQNGMYVFDDIDNSKVRIHGWSPVESAINVTIAVALFENQMSGGRTLYLNQITGEVHLSVHKVPEGVTYPLLPTKLEGGGTYYLDSLPLMNVSEEDLF